MTDDKNCKRHDWTCWFMSWKGVAILLFLAALSYYLVAEHSAHLIVALPYLILLICPLMHLFHGHAHSRNDHNSEGD
jgi:L-asparagine transporter-like permease